MAKSHKKIKSTPHEMSAGANSGEGRMQKAGMMMDDQEMNRMKKSMKISHK